jgi:hypothetical protein
MFIFFGQRVRIWKSNRLKLVGFPDMIAEDLLALIRSHLYPQIFLHVILALIKNRKEIVFDIRKNLHLVSVRFFVKRPDVVLGDLFDDEGIFVAVVHINFVSVQN